MEEIALEVLNKIFDYGYEAYIVGGFVRDKLLGNLVMLILLLMQLLWN